MAPAMSYFIWSVNIKIKTGIKTPRIQNKIKVIYRGPSLLMFILLINENAHLIFSLVCSIYRYIFHAAVYKWRNRVLLGLCHLYVACLTKMVSWSAGREHALCLYYRLKIKHCFHELIVALTNNSLANTDNYAPRVFFTCLLYMLNHVHRFN
jgi:hypothetical protein